MKAKFTLRVATEKDVDQIINVMERAKAETQTPPEWFVADDRTYMETHADKTNGFIIVAETIDRQVVAFFAVDFPGEREDNLGYDSMLDEKGRMRVAHMDTTAVLPEYRGNRLMTKMMHRVEEELIGTPYRHFLCTVHPDNHYSLDVVRSQGYQVVATREKYGGFPRHILYKRKAKPVVLVSACLLGANCRYDGGGVLDPVVRSLMEDAVLIPVCPEILGGLPTPRTPSERVKNRVLAKDGRDVTAQFEKGAQEAWRLAELYRCRCAVLKERSPSCGSGQIYDGSHSGKLMAGDGITAKLLKKHGIRVFGESKIEELKDFIDTI